ncbi:serine/threonine-protein kinase [Spirilliplanes yamanashiensis]|uniref:serine/threonine-protein kinase n=1 Tax=Spirilliplanes yamanashiensis TaxID=42233 RepID=UPI00194F6366|nr:serine/threonine-protein kinase [Spirilliplanes yamanashiensis]
MTQIPTWSSGNAPASGRAAPGTVIGGRYTLRAAVGHGGMGTVWRAADTLLRRDVAVKEVILPPGLAPSDRDSMYERTMREARAAAALQHPAVVQVYDVVQENGRPWIVMELLEARSLADMVIEDGPVPARVVAKIGIALLGALEVAHAHGVLHRDVKPANVLICSDGRCVLTDFGVARMPTDIQLTTPGMVLGSPHFISPERAMGSEFGPPSDLFSLGVTLYTAVEGRPPFDKGDPIETMHAVVEDPPAPPVRAGSLANVLLGLLEKDPAQRYDVPHSRTLLRQLLAGPLASKAPAHLMTDPYAVVPTQRPPAPPREPVSPPAPAPAPPPSGQIGGRAMLAPGESLTDRLKKVRQGGRRRAPEPAPALPEPADTAAGPWALPAPAAAQGDPTSVIPPQHSWQPGPPQQQRGTVVAASGAQRRATVEKALAAVRGGAASAAGTVRAWPRNVQYAVAGGLAAVLLLGGILLATSGDDAPTNPVAQPGASDPATVPASFATQDHAERGITVKVPKGWQRKTSGQTWIDYVDPADSKRKVRLLVEPGSAQPRRFMEIAEAGLDRKGSSCIKPYARISLTDVEMAGRPSAELQYTCGEGDELRRGVWRQVTAGGKMYSFYMTVPDARFAESRPIFDEMVRTFSVTAAG